MTLTAENVHFAYRPAGGRAAGARPVLRGVSATFEPGAVTVVVGPNGAGKSTLLRLLLGVLRPQEGRVTLHGEAVAAVPPRRRAGLIAAIAQRPVVTAAFSVRQVVRLGRFARGPDDGAVERAMAAMEVADLADEPFATLSAGQQQRVVLARALAQLEGADPPPGRQVLLADEPCSAMDPKHELHAMHILREQARLGRAVVIVLHDFVAAAALWDRAVVLGEDGRVAAAGPSEEVLRPNVLEGVFGVRFRAVERGPGEPVLLVADVNGVELARSRGAGAGGGAP